MSDIPPFFDGLDLAVRLAPGFPSVHDAYRPLTDQKDMVCGAYSLTYLLRAYGVDDETGRELTVDRVAAAAGTGLEPDAAARQDALHDRVRDGDLSADRAAAWYPRDHYAEALPEVTDEGGTSPRGLVEACEELSDGEVVAVPVPAVAGGEVQLSADRFDRLLTGVLDESFTAQVVLNYNLSETAATAGILGNRYSLVELLTQWDDPEYFHRMDWDVGHFTTLGGRVSRADSDRRYLLVRDSFGSFGWDGYHLQPESWIRAGLVRADDHRDGGLLLVSPADERADIEDQLTAIGLETDIWDNGSAYVP